VGRISQKKRIEWYCKVAGQLSENPFMHREKIAKNAKLSRNTVSEYLKSMYAKDILTKNTLNLAKGQRKKSKSLRDANISFIKPPYSSN